MIIHSGIKLRHIRVFLELANEGTLSAVARRHGITQPALTRTLQDMEALLGQQMFLRQGRRLVLTAAGTVFRRHAIAALQALDTGAAALQPGAMGGALRVGILPTVATRLFPQVALQFHQLRPEVTLSVVTGPNAHLLRQLREGEIDLMIGRMPGSGEMADLSFDHLYEDEVVLAARANHPAIGRPLRDVLPQVPLILPTAAAIIRRVVDDYLASLGLAGLRPAFETVSLAMGRGLLLDSDAVWFISQGVVLDEVERGLLAILPTGAAFLSGAVGMTQLQSRPAGPEVRILMQLLLDKTRFSQGAAPWQSHPAQLLS